MGKPDGERPRRKRRFNITFGNLDRAIGLCDLSHCEQVIMVFSRELCYGLARRQKLEDPLPFRLNLSSIARKADMTRQGMSEGLRRLVKCGVILEVEAGLLIEKDYRKWTGVHKLTARQLATADEACEGAEPGQDSDPTEENGVQPSGDTPRSGVQPNGDRGCNQLVAEGATNRLQGVQPTGCTDDRLCEGGGGYEAHARDARNSDSGETRETGRPVSAPASGSNPDPATVARLASLADRAFPGRGAGAHLRAEARDLSAAVDGRLEFAESVLRGLVTRPPKGKIDNPFSYILRAAKNEKARALSRAQEAAAVPTPEATARATAEAPAPPPGEVIVGTPPAAIVPRASKANRGGRPMPGNVVIPPLPTKPQEVINDDATR